VDAPELTMATLTNWTRNPVSIARARATNKDGSVQLGDAPAPIEVPGAERIPGADGQLKPGTVEIDKSDAAWVRKRLGAMLARTPQGARQLELSA